jgi:hypothetical protein
MNSTNNDRAPAVLIEQAVTGSVIGSFRDVDNAFGFGYRELIYSLALERDLVAKGHEVDREVAVMVCHRGEPLARRPVLLLRDESLESGIALEHRELGIDP